MGGETGSREEIKSKRKAGNRLLAMLAIMERGKAFLRRRTYDYLAVSWWGLLVNGFRGDGCLERLAGENACPTFT
jgi:hypothetical protein